MQRDYATAHAELTATIRKNFEATKIAPPDVLWDGARYAPAKLTVDAYFNALIYNQKLDKFMCGGT